MILGDMNGRTSSMQECMIEGVNDVSTSYDRNDPISVLEQTNTNKIHIQDLLANDIAVHRVNEDSKITDYGNRLVNLCLASDLIFMNGRCGFDRGRGKLTLCNIKGESTIDYVVCNKPALYIVRDFCVHDVNIISDH